MNGWCKYWGFFPSHLEFTVQYMVCSTDSIRVKAYLSCSPGLLPKLLCFFDIISDQEVIKNGARFDLNKDTKHRDSVYSGIPDDSNYYHLVSAQLYPEFLPHMKVVCTYQKAPSEW